MKGYTNFTKLHAEEIVGDVISGAVDASVLQATFISKAVDYTLSSADRDNLFAGITITAASKTVTLGLEDNQMMIIYNAGPTNAFTVKNIAADTGTSLATAKALLIVGNKTADKSIVIAIN